MGFIDALVDDAVDDVVREEEDTDTRAVAMDVSRRIEDAAKTDEEDDRPSIGPLQERAAQIGVSQAPAI